MTLMVLSCGGERYLGVIIIAVSGDLAQRVLELQKHFSPAIAFFCEMRPM